MSSSARPLCKRPVQVERRRVDLRPATGHAGCCVDDDDPCPTRDTGATALLLVDLVNPMDFDGGGDLSRHALPAARRIAELTARARAGRIPVVWVNDNFDRWHLGFRELVAHI